MSIMPPNLSDLITDSKLEIEVFDDYTIETIFVSNPTTGRRRTREQEQWQRTKKLGEGTFGVVWLDKCTRGPSLGNLRAVKELKKGSATTNYYKELEAIAKFSQERYRDNFVRSFGWYENENAVFITMEYLQLGDLEGHLMTPLREGEASLITQQILEGLKSMHDNNFAHRDLKPGNILVLHKGPRWWIKIADFGITKRLDDTALRTAIGTEAYLAPEVRGIYALDGTEDDEKTFSLAVDIWAVGAITFRMVTGRLAFPPGRKLFDYVVREQPFPREESMSPDCTNFVVKTMARSPRHRPTPQQALFYPWIQIQEPVLLDVPEECVASMNSDFDIAEIDTSLASARWSTAETVVPLAPAEASPVDVGIATPRLDTPMKERQARFQQVQKLETGNVNVKSVTFSPDGRWLASLYTSGVAQIWEKDRQARFQPVQELKVDQKVGQRGRAVSLYGLAPLAFSPNSKQLVVCSENDRMHIWKSDQIPFEIQQVVKIKSGGLYQTVAFSPNGQWLVAGNATGGVRIWEDKLGSFRQVQSLVACDFTGSRGIYSVAFSPDGHRFASSSGDNRIRAWADQQGSFRLVQILKGNNSCVHSVAFSPHGHRLPSGNSDKTVCIWEAKSGSFQLVQTLKGHDSLVYSVAFSPDGHQIVSCSSDNRIRVWEDRQGSFQLVQTLEGDNCKAAFSPDGRQIASCGHEKTVRIWELEE